MARKREQEKTIKAAQRKEKQKQALLNDKENFTTFNNQLTAIGLTLREIQGDGNCLFRALGDQLEGHGRNHLKHRDDTVEYMRNHRLDFEPFVEDDVPFDKHVGNLGNPGTYAGNDAIVAFAKLHGVTIVIHQLGAPLWQINDAEASNKNATELHIAYHNGDHYNSVRKIGDDSEAPAGIRLSIVNQKEKLNGSLQPYEEGYKNDIFHDISGQEIDEYQYSELVTRVMEKTGCQDVLLIQDTLESQMFDLSSTIECIIAFSIPAGKPSARSPLEDPPCQANPGGLWGPWGTGTRLFGNTEKETGMKVANGEKGAKPKSTALEKLSGKQRKEFKRQERKRNSDERKRSKLRNSDGRESDDSGDHYCPDIAVDALGCLSI